MRAIMGQKDSMPSICLVSFFDAKKLKTFSVKNNVHVTSKSVSEGQHDKVADKILKVILDSYLELDQNAKVA